jgi:hypothetical protein
MGFLMMVTMRFNQKSVYEALAVLGRARGAISDLRPVWSEFLPVLVGCLTSNFLNQGTIEGPWKPLLPVTLKRKRERDQMLMILVATGQMMRATTQRGVAGNICLMDERSLTWGVDMQLAGAPRNYAYFQDVTGVRRRTGEKVVREFMVLDQPTIIELERILARRIKAQVKGEAA